MFELQGKLTRPSGEVYDGAWHNGQRQGRGVMVGVDGSKYTGDFYKDDRHGKGSMVDSNGSSYEGDWQYNCRHGLGTYQVNFPIWSRKSFLLLCTPEHT